MGKIKGVLYSEPIFLNDIRKIKIPRMKGNICSGIFESI